ncbi:hypothetical protein VNO80_00704 [Phaseolus coccineus]|uniref:Uncharacterized protein n=1 Tax=Phaseolus coccineus TaxID=3886 RepID=A0AAN9NZ82_PHACN
MACLITYPRLILQILGNLDCGGVPLFIICTPLHFASFITSIRNLGNPAEIVTEANPADPKETNPMLTFPTLTSLTLWDLPKFKHNTIHSIHDATAKHLTVGENELKMTVDGEFQTNLLHKLKAFTLHFHVECDEFPDYGFLQQLPNIKKLVVCDFSFKVMFCCESSKNSGLLLQLKELHLESLGELVSIGIVKPRLESDLNFAVRRISEEKRQMLLMWPRDMLMWLHALLGRTHHVNFHHPHCPHSLPRLQSHPFRHGQPVPRLLPRARHHCTMSINYSPPSLPSLQSFCRSLSNISSSPPNHRHFDTPRRFAAFAPRLSHLFLLPLSQSTPVHTALKGLAAETLSVYNNSSKILILVNYKSLYSSLQKRAIVISSWLALLASALLTGGGNNDLCKKVSNLARDMKLTQFKGPSLSLHLF